MAEKIYYTVVFSLIKKLDGKSDKEREDILSEILCMLVDRKVCTLSDVNALTKKFEEMINEVEAYMKKGCQYLDAFMNVSKKFNDFDFMILN